MNEHDGAECVRDGAELRLLWRLVTDGGYAGSDRAYSDLRAIAARPNSYDISRYLAQALRPVPMILVCPSCSERHIDRGEFADKSHHTHACQGCGGPGEEAHEADPPGRPGVRA